MFNKTAILKNKKIKSFYKSNPKLIKAYNLKKSFTNLKTSFTNNNSSNTSNINLKTSSNSKISPESAYIRKVQTQVHPKTKKSLFDYKEKESNLSSGKLSRKKAHSLHYKISSSAKTNKLFKISIKGRTHFYSEDNEMKSKGYYLTGELPYRDKYIVEMKNNNLNLNSSKKKENFTQ